MEFQACSHRVLWSQWWSFHCSSCLLSHLSAQGSWVEFLQDFWWWRRVGLSWASPHLFLLQSWSDRLSSVRGSLPRWHTRTSRRTGPASSRFCVFPNDECACRSEHLLCLVDWFVALRTETHPECPSQPCSYSLHLLWESSSSRWPCASNQLHSTWSCSSCALLSGQYLLAHSWCRRFFFFKQRVYSQRHWGLLSSQGLPWGAGWISWSTRLVRFPVWLFSLIYWRTSSWYCLRLLSGGSSMSGSQKSSLDFSTAALHTPAIKGED